MDPVMKAALILALLTSCFALAQDAPPPPPILGPPLQIQIADRVAGGGAVAFTAGPALRDAAPVQGAPYSASITNESVQTLADGNRIVQTTTGTIARDSLGRTRQDLPLPAIGNVAPANAPHLVFLQDPVAQTSYTLNLNDKTAMKAGAMMLPPPGEQKMTARVAVMGASVADGPQPRVFAMQRTMSIKDEGQVNTEDLGSQTLEGVLVTGTRMTRTIPAGQIGNDKPISVVTEVWTSPDLKTVVYSKRTDPRIGEQTFKLTNIVRAEPDPALFTVPADFKVLDGPEPIVYHANQ